MDFVQFQPAVFVCKYRGNASSRVCRLEAIQFRSLECLASGLRLSVVIVGNFLIARIALGPESPLPFVPFLPIGGSGGREFIGIIQVIPVDKRQKS